MIGGSTFHGESDGFTKVKGTGIVLPLNPARFTDVPEFCIATVTADAEMLVTNRPPKSAALFIMTLDRVVPVW
jgi:hypothetical protein